MYQQVMRRQAIYQVSPDLLRRFDPLALSPLASDHAAYYFSKRVLDVIVATLALVILSPVLVLIAVLGEP